jgi:holo-[acyl-carrier protein] synthase
MNTQSSQKAFCIGFDAIEIHRFNHWHTYSYQQLSRVFSCTEIKYCQNKHTKQQAQHFAGRFAAKEALYKALSPAVSFLQFCKQVEIRSDQNGKPTVHGIATTLPPISISISHTRTTAYAIVLCV